MLYELSSQFVKRTAPSFLDESFLWTVSNTDICSLEGPLTAKVDKLCDICGPSGLGQRQWDDGWSHSIALLKSVPVTGLGTICGMMSYPKECPGRGKDVLALGCFRKSQIGASPEMQ